MSGDVLHRLLFTTRWKAEVSRANVLEAGRHCQQSDIGHREAPVFLWDAMLHTAAHFSVFVLLFLSLDFFLFVAQYTSQVWILPPTGIDSLKVQQSVHRI